MQKHLFINTSFEEELTSSSLLTPQELLKKHPIYLQLHFLSCLISEADEVPLLAFRPEKDYFSRLGHFAPKNTPLFLDNGSFEGKELLSWGASSSLSLWAQKEGCIYKVPSPATVKKVHSKAFSFSLGKGIEGAALIQEEKDLLLWLDLTKGNRVLKTFYGSSGKGHCLLLEGEKNYEPAKLLLKKHPEGLIAQPWVERLLDFSSQWKIQEDGSYVYLGATICENSKRGTYRRSLVGPSELLFPPNAIDFLEEHLVYAQKAIQEMSALGFYGNMGIDAMLYKKNETTFLEPILEINARKTMGWVALQLYKKNPNAFSHLMSLSYGKKEDGVNLLPDFAFKENENRLDFKWMLKVCSFDHKNLVNL